MNPTETLLHLSQQILDAIHTGGTPAVFAMNEELARGFAGDVSP